MNEKAYLALFFIEHPQYEGCSYEECVMLLKKLYNVEITISQLQKLYIPYYYYEENLTLY